MKFDPPAFGLTVLGASHGFDGIVFFLQIFFKKFINFLKKLLGAAPDILFGLMEEEL
jgi:hypothetical protein